MPSSQAIKFDEQISERTKENRESIKVPKDTFAKTLVILTLT